MLAVAGIALWLGGWAWAVFVAAVAVVLLWEWRGLVRGFKAPGLGRFAWNACGFVYIAVAAYALLVMREYGLNLLLFVGAVIGTDIGGYFAGRAVGGPKIAPRISPSKTWSGLIGGMVGAALAIVGVTWAWWIGGVCDVFHPLVPTIEGQAKFAFDGPCHGYMAMPPIGYLVGSAAVTGPIIAIIAQSGDFFESWMKRRAGVKDSSSLIPGHGGVLDRLDGLLAVLFVIGLWGIVVIGATLAGGGSLLPAPA